MDFPQGQAKTEFDPAVLPCQESAEHMEKLKQKRTRTEKEPRDENARNK